MMHGKTCRTTVPVEADAASEFSEMAKIHRS